MKLGQMAAFIDPILTEGERRALARLRERAKPMTSAEVYRVVHASLGLAPREAFASWSPAPYRCGSVGQVHRAELDGRKVAVKIQYPDARRTMREDLQRWLKTAWPAQQPDVVFAEISKLLEEELDFVAEADNLERVHRSWAHDPRMVIPAVIRERSGEDVLTMEWSTGQPLDEWMPTASRASRRNVAETLWEFYVGSLYIDGCFNADPHPGNILVAPGERLAFVDFGRQKQVASRVEALYRHRAREHRMRRPGSRAPVRVVLAAEPGARDPIHARALRAHDR
jgi:ubiquinone biosynthesis protein